MILDHDRDRRWFSPAGFLARIRELRAELVTKNDMEFDRFLGRIKDGKRFDAPRRLSASKEYFTSLGYLMAQERADWQATDARLCQFAGGFDAAMRRFGIPFYAHSAFRTRAHQDDLFDRGRSKAMWPRAPHCQGKAVDLVHARYHWQLTPKEWQFVGKVGKEVADKLGLKVEWGGDWSFYDPAHWQLADWDQSIQRIVPGVPERYTLKRLRREFPAKERR